MQQIYRPTAIGSNNKYKMSRAIKVRNVWHKIFSDWQSTCFFNMKSIIWQVFLNRNESNLTKNLNY